MWFDQSARLVRTFAERVHATPHRGGVRWLAVVGIIGVAVLIVFTFTDRGRASSSLSLVDAYPQTLKRSSFPALEAFSVYDAAIGEQTRRAVYARPPSRITWKVTPPPAATLIGWLAVRNEGWAHPGDGVVFRIGVSDGRVYRELLNRHVAPYTNAGDRRWIDVSVPLEAFAGKTVDIIFNTDMGLPGAPADGKGDLALWGDPRIVTPR